jgi:hypothetical protein
LVSPEILGISITLYIIIIVIFIILTLFTYRKFQDKNFITGLVFSGVLNSLPFLAFPSIFFFIWYFLGGLFGFIAGYFNTKIKLGALSGALGILFSFILFGILSPLGFLIFYSVYFIFIVIIPSILSGALGGFIGSKIRVRSETN